MARAGLGRLQPGVDRWAATASHSRPRPVTAPRGPASGGGGGTFAPKVQQSVDRLVKLTGHGRFVREAVTAGHGQTQQATAGRGAEWAGFKSPQGFERPRPATAGHGREGTFAPASTGHSMVCAQGRASATRGPASRRHSRPRPRGPAQQATAGRGRPQAGTAGRGGNRGGSEAHSKIGLK